MYFETYSKRCIGLENWCEYMFILMEEDWAALKFGAKGVAVLLRVLISRSLLNVSMILPVIISLEA